jgi:hypothetical protein
LNTNPLSLRLSASAVLLLPDGPKSPRCDTSQTVTPSVAAAHRSRLFSGARVKNMGTEIILAIVIVSPVVFSAAVLLWASEEWLHAFGVLARSLGRPM